MEQLVHQPEIGLSPAKRATMGMEQSPMFTPLEVKFKSMKKFESNAKKNMSGRKFTTIETKEVGTRL